MTTGSDRIRRLDWRFLLADPRVRSVVMPDGDRSNREPTDGLAQLGASSTGPEDGRTGGIPVILVRDPDAARLARALELRDADSSVVVESTHRRQRWTVERRLRRAGLPVRSFGAWPSVAAPTRFVPLGDRSELVVNARAAKNRRRRAIGVALSRLGLGSSIFAESVSVAGPAGEPAPPAALLVAFGEGRDGAGTMTLLTPRFASSRHVIALVTGRTGRSLVVKTSRLPSDDRQLRSEARGLRAIGDGGPPRPHLVGDAEWFGQRWIVQTRIDGEPLSRRHVVRQPERWTAAAGRWLAQMPTHDRSTPDQDGRSERLIRPALDEIAAQARREPRLGALVDDAERAFGILRSSPLPIVCEHGDFRPPNLIVTRTGEIAAVDWELAEPSGLPLHDMLFFHGYVVSIVPELRDDLRRIARRALIESGVEPDLFDPLVSLASLRHLATEVVRLAGDGDAPPRTVADSPIARQWFQDVQTASLAAGPEAVST